MANTDLQRVAERRGWPAMANWTVYVARANGGSKDQEFDE